MPSAAHVTVSVTEIPEVKAVIEQANALQDAVGRELHVLHGIATRLERAAERAPFVQISGRPLSVLAREAREAHVAIDAAHRAYLEAGLQAARS